MQASRADDRTRKQGVTLRLLEELGVSGKPVIEVYNKMDAAVDADFIPPAAVCISAATGAASTDCSTCWSRPPKAAAAP